MEKLNIQKPCVVETPQGFSVSYKERFLYSKYNPTKLINSTIEQLQILPGTIFLCVSPALCYGLKELLEKLPENCLVYLCEFDKELWELTAATGISLPKDKVFFPKPGELYDLPLKIFDNCKTGKYRRVVRLDFSAGYQFMPELYTKLNDACVNSVKTFLTNRLTLTKFGRKYSHNFFSNLKHLGNTTPMENYIGKITKPIIVVGAGESADELKKLFTSERSPSQGDGHLEGDCLHSQGDGHLEGDCPHSQGDGQFTNERSPSQSPENFFIICVDTILPALISQNIIPDGVFVEEAQVVISQAFICKKHNVHLFAGLSSLPQLYDSFPPENISYFATEYATGAFFTLLERKHILPVKNPPFGSVGLTATYYAVQFRKDSSVPVYVTGLDFGYSVGPTHGKGTIAHKNRLLAGNKLKPIENYGAAFLGGAQVVRDKRGEIFITTPALSGYCMLFRNLFGAVENIVDIGSSGLGLSIAGGGIERPGKQADAKALLPSAYSAEFNLKLKEYLRSEKEDLIALRNLLTEKSSLSPVELEKEITKKAAGKEYLYLHFPDGYCFNYNQSVLNRIRTEIDFFLKVFD